MGSGFSIVLQCTYWDYTGGYIWGHQQYIPDLKCTNPRLWWMHIQNLLSLVQRMKKTEQADHITIPICQFYSTSLIIACMKALIHLQKKQNKPILSNKWEVCFSFRAFFRMCRMSSSTTSSIILHCYCIFPLTLTKHCSEARIDILHLKVKTRRLDGNLIFNQFKIFITSREEKRQMH